jgi:hypothetical protein
LNGSVKKRHRNDRPKSFLYLFCIYFTIVHPEERLG